MTDPPGLSVARGVRVIHGALVVGTVLVGVVLAVARYAAGNPLLAADRTAGLVPAAACTALVLMGVTVLRQRVSTRAFDETPEAFWTPPETRGQAILLWTTIESGSIAALIAYYLTGGLAPAAAAAIALLVKVHMRPGRLEEDGTS